MDRRDEEKADQGQSAYDFDRAGGHPAQDRQRIGTAERQKDREGKAEPAQQDGRSRVTARPPQRPVCT